MASKAVSAVLVVSLVAVILGSANLYLIYNVQQSFQNDLQSANRDLELANQALTESSQKLELLDQRLLSLQDEFGQANQDSQKQIANLGNELSATTQELGVTSQELTAAREQLTAMSLQLNFATENLDALSNEVSSQESLLTDAATRIKGVDIQLKDIDTQITGVDSRIKDLETQIGSVRSEQQATPESVYEQARASVVLIRVSGLSGSGVGSGFLYSATNYIVTNFHVIDRATSINVEFHEGSQRVASLVGQDPFSDLAVLAITNPPQSVKSLELGDSSALRVGQPVVAIGNPFGLTGSLSTGVVSQTGRLLGPDAGIPLVVPVIQLDLTIAPGNSGGPLLDMQSNVLGVTNIGSQWGINFAVPSNIIKRVADSIIQTGKYDHPFVGFNGVALTPESISSFNIVNVDPSVRGIMIIQVFPGTPAEAAGLRPADAVLTPQGQGYRANDIIVTVDGRELRSFADWSNYVEENVSAGQTIQLGLLRLGKIVILPITTTVRT